MTTHFNSNLCTCFLYRRPLLQICNLKIVTQADGLTCANIRVSSQQEAQFAISQLHRQKLGQKRIVISYAQNNVSDPEHLKALIVNILQVNSD